MILIHQFNSYNRREKEYLKFIEFVLAAFCTAKNVISFRDRKNSGH